MAPPSTTRLICLAVGLLALSALGACNPVRKLEVLQFCAIDATTSNYLPTASVKEGSETRARRVDPSSSCRTLRKVVGSADEPRNPKLDQTVHFQISAPGYMSRRMHYRVKRHRNTVVVGLRRTYTIDRPSEEELMVKTYADRWSPPCPDDCSGCLRTPTSLQLTGTCYTLHHQTWLDESGAVDLGTDATVDKPILSWPTTRLPSCRYTKDQVHRCKKRK